jgi:hypothetical protein
MSIRALIFPVPSFPAVDGSESAAKKVKKSFPSDRGWSYFGDSEALGNGRTADVQSEAAQTLALQALGWIAADDEMFPLFLNATGANLADLRLRAADPDFQAAVLDFLLQDDRWVVAFCDAAGQAYTAPQAARATLPGGTAVNWT